MSPENEHNKGHFGAAYTLKTGEETRRHYRSWAESYDREVGVENGYAQPGRTGELLQRFQPGSDIEVLGAGCGSGTGSGRAIGPGVTI